MDRKELLKIIEERELARLNSLTYEQLEIEVNDWFNDQAVPSESKSEIINDYLMDYMKYRYDESDSELLERVKLLEKLNK